MKYFKKLFVLFLFLSFAITLVGCFNFRPQNPNNPDQKENTPKKPNEKIENVFAANDVDFIKEEYHDTTKQLALTYKVTTNDIKQILIFYKTYTKEQEIIESDFIRIDSNIDKDVEKTLNIPLKKYAKIDFKFITNKDIKSYDTDNYYFLLVNNGNAGNYVVSVSKLNNKFPFLKPNLNNNYAIRGYYYDIYQNKPVESNDLVESNNIIYAEITLDFKIINKLQTDTIKSNVTIYASHFYGSGQSQGSGAVIQETQKGFFILTNSHVVTTYQNGHKIDLTNIQVENYKKQRSSGHLVYNAPKYDLAIIFVYKENTFWDMESMKDLKPLKLAKKNPQVGDLIIAIGQPKGQKNVITTGRVQGYDQIKLKDGVSPEFKTIKHSAPIDHGSSGGILLNTANEICGINFAGSTDLASEDPNCYAIPVEKIRAMIEEYNKTVK